MRTALDALDDPDLVPACGPPCPTPRRSGQARTRGEVQLVPGRRGQSSDRLPGEAGNVMVNSPGDPAAASAEALLTLYRQKRLSPVETARAVHDRIRRFEAAVNAFALVDEERALADARESEARWQRGEPQGLLDGVPTTIKDLVLTRGWPTLRGSRVIHPDQPWHDDAPATARLKEHGAILIGKTTTPEFGWKAVTDNALTGITRNPWNTRTTPGGSSGGAAAAAALGMGALHIGTDGGGSIRIPAAFTGIFGHKPSFGRVPAWPLSPFGTVSHLGPMTRTVGDAALMLTVLASPDARDWFALPVERRDYRIGLDEGVRGLRIAFSADLGHARVDAEIASAVAEGARVFGQLGARVEEVDPGIGDTSLIFRQHWYAGAANLLRRFTPDERALIDPGLQAIAAEAETFALLDYLAAVDARGELGHRMRVFHETYDLLLTPAVPVAAFEAGHEVPPGSGMSRWVEWSPFSNPFNLTQQPACSIPCGFTASGLPIGLQLVGPMHDDALVLRAARAFESAQPWPFPEAPRTPNA